MSPEQAAHDLLTRAHAASPASVFIDDADLEAAIAGFVISIISLIVALSLGGRLIGL